MVASATHAAPAERPRSGAKGGARGRRASLIAGAGGNPLLAAAGANQQEGQASAVPSISEEELRRSFDEWMRIAADNVSTVPLPSLASAPRVLAKLACGQDLGLHAPG
jgi:hypothetical protein